MTKRNWIKWLILLALIYTGSVLFNAVRGTGEYIMFVSKGGSIDIRRTDNGQMAGPFLVLGQVSQGIYRLGSEDDSTGVYTVTFKDQTRRPGRFTLAVGGSMLDIMPARIVFNKTEHQWGQQPQQSAPPNHRSPSAPVVGGR